MNSRQLDRRIRCPYCAEAITILIDLSADSQSYIEDCEVCCQPMQISYEAEDDELRSLQVDRAS